MVRNERGNVTFRQWDINQRLIIRGYAADTEIHFISGDDCYTMMSYADGNNIYVDVPNILFQTAGLFVVYVYTDDHSEDKTVFTVYRRAKPKDYIYTETEVLAWETLDNKIKAIEDKIKTLDDKADKMSPFDALVLLTETGIVDPVTDADGSVFVDDTGTVYVL